MFEMLTSSDVLQKCPAPATVSSGPLAEASWYFKILWENFYRDIDKLPSETFARGIIEPIVDIAKLKCSDALFKSAKRTLKALIL